MPIVPLQTQATPEASAVLLAAYAKMIGVEECAFWGVNSGASPAYACRQIWSLHDRNLIAKYLSEAQIELENALSFPIGARWFTDEQHRYVVPVHTRWGYVIAPGVMATADVSLAEAVDHTADPAVIGPIVTALTDVDEIHVYHAGTDVEIIPSSIVISGGNLTIDIPRCRLVLPAYASNPVTGWSYTDTTPAGVFAQTVDVKRVYNSQATAGVLVYPHGCSTSCTCGCDETTQTACLYLRNPTTGALDALPATYSNGSWTPTSACCCGLPEYVRLNYYAGVDLDYQLEDMIVRLAHSKMPEAPCGCPEGQRLWARDRNIPTVLTAERLNCPFGINDGAWVAWQFTVARRLVRGYTL